jgi:dCMP deaminase
MLHTSPLDEHFLNLTELVGEMATCDRGRTACVIVRGETVVSSGFAHAPSEQASCDKVGHLFQQVVGQDGLVHVHCIRTIHSVQDAIAKAARNGISVGGATVYCTMEPCRSCALLLVAAGVSRVVAKYRYHDGIAARTIFRDAAIELLSMLEMTPDYAEQIIEPSGGVYLTNKSGSGRDDSERQEDDGPLADEVG